MMSTDRSTFAGYRFQPRLDPRSPGHQRLDVFLRAQPTQEHFDPERLWLTLTETGRSADMGPAGLVEMSHPWPGPASLRWTVGPIDLIDRRGKKVEAFGFGGSLHVESAAEMTHVVLESEAPILELLDEGSFPYLLAEEVEIVLAELRGQARSGLAELETELGRADPLALYLACLSAIRARLSRIDRKGPPPYRRMLNAIDGELQAQRDQGRAPEHAPSLSDLIGPVHVD